MTAVAHYVEAERLLQRAAGGEDRDPDLSLLAAAQVHATLALAGATALMQPVPLDGNANAPQRWMEPRAVEVRAWIDAAGTPEPERPTATVTKL